MGRGITYSKRDCEQLLVEKGLKFKIIRIGQRYYCMADAELATSHGQIPHFLIMSWATAYNKIFNM